MNGSSVDLNSKSIQVHRKRTKVVHFSSGHFIPDIRVFEKECRALADAGYEVTVVARHPGDEVIEGVRIVAVKSAAKTRRLKRLTKVVWDVYRTAARQKADIYHFHDPELLLAGLLLKLRGRKVIYDAHEAFRLKLLSKSWIPRMLRPACAALYGWVERCICRMFDHVIAADRTAAEDFLGSRVTVVANYPILTEARRRIVPRETPATAASSSTPAALSPTAARASCWTLPTCSGIALNFVCLAAGSIRGTSAAPTAWLM